MKRSSVDLSPNIFIRWFSHRYLKHLQTCTLMITMSTELDYVSEMRPPTCLFFIPRVIYQHGEPWWNDIDRGNSLLVNQSSLVFLKQSHLVENQKEVAKQMNFAWGSIFVHTLKCSSTFRKTLRHGPTALLPSEWRRAAYFYRTWITITSAEFEPADLRSNGKQSNHRGRRRRLVSYCPTRSETEAQLRAISSFHFTYLHLI
jgi:hypothetical protein